jgi:hypothetical protein
VARPVQSILAKSGTANRTEASVLATEYRLIDADDANHEGRLIYDWKRRLRNDGNDHGTSVTH